MVDFRVTVPARVSSSARGHSAPFPAPARGRGDSERLPRHVIYRWAGPRIFRDTRCVDKDGVLAGEPQLRGSARRLAYLFQSISNLTCSITVTSSWPGWMGVKPLASLVESEGETELILGEGRPHGLTHCRGRAEFNSGQKGQLGCLLPERSDHAAARASSSNASLSSTLNETREKTTSSPAAVVAPSISPQPDPDL